MSIRSIFLFFMFNTTVLTFSYYQYIFNIPTIIFLLFKQYTLLKFIEISSSNKPYIYHQKHIDMSTNYKIFYFLQSVLMEYIAYSYIPKTHSEYIINDIILFIPISFAFEIIFDFFHYCSHRLFHTFPRIYKYHAVHHSHNELKPISAFQHHWIDLLFTNTFPFILTGYVLSLLVRLTSFSITSILWFKTLVEIGGNCGKYIKGSSFPQCIWIPRLFNIEMYSKHHADHHKYGTKNYSKRFLLWDKIFGTT